MTKAAVIGLGTMGPGIAATLARAGMTVTAFDTMRRAARQGARRTASVTATGVLAVSACARPQRRASRSRSMRRSRRRPSKGADARHRRIGAGEGSSIKTQVLQRDRQARRQKCVIASNTSGHSHHQAAGRQFGARPRGRHALVEPAPRHPDHRGDRRQAKRAQATVDLDDRVPSRDLGAHAGRREEGRAGLRREPHPLCASCAKAWTWSSRA